MDIMRPPLKQQVSPAPWLVARSKVDVPALIRKVHTEQPDASANDIVRQLSDWGVQASGIIVSMWLRKMLEQEVAARIADEKSPAVVASPLHEVGPYCTCAPLPCTCCKPTPAWWHQYCCEVLESEEQIPARDEHLEHATTS